MSSEWTSAAACRATGQNIKSLRTAAGISVRELQVIFGFTNPQSIYSWQNGSSLPTIDNLIILSTILGVTIDEIISVEEEDADEDESMGINQQSPYIS